MDTVMIKDKKNTLMIAHRGLSGIERENTCSAFIAAANRSYFGIETDVHVTSDGHYVIMHDDTTGRVADRNLRISKSRLRDLSDIILKDTDGSFSRRDLRVPLLQDYMNICTRYRKTAVIELKDFFTDRQLDEIYDICSKHGDPGNIIFISFHYSNVYRMRLHHPGQRVQFLSSDIDDGLIEKVRDDGIGLDIEYTSLNEDYVKKCRELGIELNCWTVNDKKAAEKLIDWGVGYVTTNILE